MLVYEAVGETLKRLGVDTLFGLMGDGNMRFVAHAGGELGLHYYTARHEGGAVAMADGYARASNRVGVATVTQGPGVTNTLTALTEAAKGGSSLLLIAGQTPTMALRHSQAVDQAAVFASTGIAVQRVRGPATVIADVALAYNRARLEQRPIAVSIPSDMSMQPCPPGPLGQVRIQAVARHRPDDAAIAEVCDLIERCERPVILAGRGATRSRARPALEALGDRIGALLASSVQAKGFFAGQRYNAGVSGGFASEAGCRLLEKGDLVLAFGASLTHWVTRNKEQYARSAKYVHVDAKSAAIGALTPVDCGVVGDAAASAEALLAELERRELRKDGFRIAALENDVAALHQLPAFEDQSDGRRIDPRAVICEMERALPAERTVVCDSGHSIGWPTQFLSAPDSNGFIFANDFMVVGLGLGMALGAAVARPDRMTVLAPGDGGVLMGMSELESIARYKLPILILLFNDRGYGVEVLILQNLKQPTTHAEFPDVDFAAVARGFGIGGLTVRTMADLAPVKVWIADPKGPLLVDCKVNRFVIGRWFEENLDPESWYGRMSKR